MILRGKGNVSLASVVSLHDALYCRKYGLDPLNTMREVLSPGNGLYVAFHNREIPPYPKEDTVNCKAVETEKGVVLFSDDESGSRSMKSYLQYLANDFYSPNFGVETLRIHNIAAQTEEVAGKVNLCFAHGTPGEADVTAEDPVPQAVYADPGILKNGYCEKEYDMRATQENFWKLANFDTGEDLGVTQRNWDIAGLQYTVRYGYDDGIAEDSYYPGMAFSYAEQFDGIGRRTDHAANEQEKQQTGNEGRTLAGAILQRDFPDIRRSLACIPDMQRQGVSRYIDRDAFETLLKPEPPRQVPSVTPKKGKGKTI